jgi:hypothetical protein
MAVDLTPKQTGFVSRYRDTTTDFLRLADKLANLKSEWDANAFATGASPAGNNITDTTVQAAAPAATALQLNQAIGAVESIRTTIAANRGYLEALRP